MYNLFVKTHVENIWPPGALISGLISKSAPRPQELKVLIKPMSNNILEIIDIFNAFIITNLLLGAKTSAALSVFPNWPLRHSSKSAIISNRRPWIALQLEF
jgi:hypothetical protein